MLPVLLACTPLAAVLVAMAALHLSAIKAGAIGLGLAAALLATPYFSLSAPGTPATLGAMGAGAEALSSAFTIVWIVLPALALYAFQDRVGALERLRDALTGLTDNRRCQALLIAWFFGLFIEGAAGFGTPVALATPLLYGLGYSPVRAVVLALLGHAAGVSFGAVGTPTLAQVELTGFAPTTLAGDVALFHAIIGWALLFATVKVADETPFSARDTIWTLLAGLCFFAPFVLLARFAGPELPSLGGALIGVAGFIIALQVFGPAGSAQSVDTAEAPPSRDLIHDVAPYLFIVALILITRLIGPVQEVLSGLALQWSLMDRFSGAFAPLYHPGTLMWLGILGSALLSGRLGAVGPALATALARGAAVGLALLIMLGLSRLMVHAGMIDMLALAASQTGTVWPLLAPGIGVLGTFITGSATTSNILFTEFQLTAADALSLTPQVMVALQGFGSAVGNVVAPHNIIAGAATVGLLGKESAVLRQTLALGLGCALAGGALGFVLLQLDAAPQ